MLLEVKLGTFDNELNVSNESKWEIKDDSCVLWLNIWVTCTTIQMKNTM